jgi:hypothetical protein
MRTDPETIPFSYDEMPKVEKFSGIPFSQAKYRFEHFYQNPFVSSAGSA